MYTNINRTLFHLLIYDEFNNKADLTLTRLSTGFAFLLRH